METLPWQEAQNGTVELFRPLHVDHVTGALDAEEGSGTFTVGGFINYSQAVRRDLLDDELYGGATMAYSW